MTEKPRMLEAIDFEAARAYARKNCSTCNGTGGVSNLLKGRSEYRYVRSCLCAVTRWHDAMAKWLKENQPSQAGLVDAEGNPVTLNPEAVRGKDA